MAVKKDMMVMETVMKVESLDREQSIRSEPMAMHGLSPPKKLNSAVLLSCLV